MANNFLIFYGTTRGPTLDTGAITDERCSYGISCFILRMLTDLHRNPVMAQGSLQDTGFSLHCTCVAIRHSKEMSIRRHKIMISLTAFRMFE